MKTVTQHIRAHILGPLAYPAPPKLPGIEALFSTEWHPPFEALQRNRLVMATYRYGRIAADNGGRYDRIGSAIERLELYRHDGDGEHLVDAANLCMVEFAQCGHPTPAFGGRGELDRIGVMEVGS